RRQRGDGPHFAGRQRPAGSGAAGEPLPPVGGPAQQHAGPAAGAGRLADPGWRKSAMPRRQLELVGPRSALEIRQSKLFDRLLSALVALSLALLGWLYLRSRD